VSKDKVTEKPRPVDDDPRRPTPQEEEEPVDFDAGRDGLPSHDGCENDPFDPII